MKTQFSIWTSFIIVILIGANTADAQWYAGSNAGLGYGLGVAYGAAYGGGFSAQTPMSANAIGMSALVRSQGEYNVLSSQAAINYEKARNIYIDNEQKAYAARQSIRRAGKARMAEDNAAAHASLDRANEFLATHQTMPLPSSQLNPGTGHIDWPTALNAPEFAEMRKSIDSLFEIRAKSGGTANLASQIEKTAAEIKDLLRDQITKIPLNDYSAARRFLDSMIASARA